VVTDAACGTGGGERGIRDPFGDSPWWTASLRVSNDIAFVVHLLFCVAVPLLFLSLSLGALCGVCSSVLRMVTFGRAVCRAVCVVDGSWRRIDSSIPRPEPSAVCE